MAGFCRIANGIFKIENMAIWPFHQGIAHCFFFSHSIIHITTISSFTPSSAACPVGVQFLPWMERRQCSFNVYGALLWNALVVERASKQNGHAHTFHRSTSSVGLAGADGEFPVTRAATELMHDLLRKNTTTISPALWLLSFH